MVLRHLEHNMRDDDGYWSREVVLLFASNRWVLFVLSFVHVWHCGLTDMNNVHIQIEG
jgi:hypothetical protein